MLNIYGTLITQKDNPTKMWTMDLNRHVSRGIQIGYRHIKRCAISLAIREMKIKTLTRFHFASTRMAVIKTQISVGEDVENSKSSYTTGRNGKWCSCFGKQSGSPKKIKQRVPIRPSNSTPGCIYPREMRTYVRAKTCSLTFIAALFTIVKKSGEKNRYP